MMFIRLLRILADIEEKLKSNLPVSVLTDFYTSGKQKMQDYLEQFDDFGSGGLDWLGDRTAQYYAEGKDLDEAVYLASVEFVLGNERYKEVIATPWFDVISILIRQAVGYTDRDGSGQFSQPPSNMPYLQKMQLAENEQELIRQVISGLEDAEELFVENAARAYFRDFEGLEDAVEIEKNLEPDVEPDVEKEDDVDPDFIQEPSDYSGRYANALA
jgi:hypothetical protein